jgi:hypothetical protein
MVNFSRENIIKKYVLVISRPVYNDVSTMLFFKISKFFSEGVRVHNNLTRAADKCARVVCFMLPISFSVHPPSLIQNTVGIFYPFFRRKKKACGLVRHFKGIELPNLSLVAAVHFYFDELDS